MHVDSKLFIAVIIRWDEIFYWGCFIRGRRESYAFVQLYCNLPGFEDCILFLMRILNYS